MGTMSYPCSPLIPFPTQHEEMGSYLLWSPQAVIPLENGVMCDGDAGSSPDHQQQQDNDELMNMLLQEANVLLLQDELSSGDPSSDGFDQRLLGGQGNGGLLLGLGVQEEVMEESSLGDLLVAGARAVESRDTISASAILSRIDAIIPGVGVPYNGSCHRAAVDHLARYFAQGLRSRMSGECRPTADAPALPPLGRKWMAADRILQELSPFAKFAHFTANQAILEGTADDAAVHVVDLNVGEGAQWASLMSDLARHGSRRKPFRLTEAVVTADADADAHRMAATARRLSEFADSLGLPFQYGSVRVRSDEDLHGFATSCCSCSVVVSCDTTDIRSYSSLTKLLAAVVRILRPKLVVTTEEELLRAGRNHPGAAAITFAGFFREALQHFGAVLESLASCFRDAGYGACLGLVEREALGPRIQDAVGQYQCAGSVTGGASLELEGFRAREMSSFSVAQGRMLAGLFSGFGVVHGDGRLALCWKSRPLTSVSVWTPVW
ncbi:Nodulation-signaling pathway 2 protein [Zea mays]|uniref:Nodulation-signaling pathway 2 protein n=1 Tax=Zea mays TaxID=4577 RepID=A0A3L6FBD3_MAIZE|nr:Nodulation-signaling pathway 2 protein [Zea mays]